MKKKLFILLAVMLVLSIAVAASPLVPFILERYYALEAQGPSDSSPVVQSSEGAGSDDTTGGAAQDSSSGSEQSSEPEEPNKTAIIIAVILSAVTIALSVAVYIKKSRI